MIIDLHADDEAFLEFSAVEPYVVNASKWTAEVDQYIQVDSDSTEILWLIEVQPSDKSFSFRGKSYILASGILSANHLSGIPGSVWYYTADGWFRAGNLTYLLNNLEGGFPFYTSYFSSALTPHLLLSETYEKDDIYDY